MMEVNKLRVLNDYVLVEGIRDEIVDGIVSGVTLDDKPSQGRVIKAGPGRILENGERSEMTITPGMQVLFNEHTTTKFKIGKSRYYVLREEDCVAYQ